MRVNILEIFLLLFAGFVLGIGANDIFITNKMQAGESQELLTARRTTAAALDVARITKAMPEDIVWKRERLVKADGELFGEILMWFYMDETLTQEEEVINGN